MEHPFGTLKRNWNTYYILTRGICSVGAEMALSFMVYNLSRAIKILGTEEIIKLLLMTQSDVPLTNRVDYPGRLVIFLPSLTK